MLLTPPFFKHTFTRFPKKNLSRLVFFDRQPFIGNAYSCIGGAGEGDVVERIEELGEDVAVESRPVSIRPFPNWREKVKVESDRIAYERIAYEKRLVPKNPLSYIYIWDEKN